jgi:pyruvate/2-oxoglutarate/acetoin dehydrogenase E1 component
MRVAENLNRALGWLLETEPRAYLLGEDVVDPYGGAFKVTKGLSGRFPDRVLATPLSEAAIVGMAAGLALAGDTAVVEIMFGDFIALAFDQLFNFASKSVSMYGRRESLRLIVRCPVGGRRGYGPTHSQSPQKHFVGIPGLSLYELSPFHDNRAVLSEILATAEPAVLFEDKVLYPQQMLSGGTVDGLISFDVAESGVARAYIGDPEGSDCVLITPGGLAHRAMRAMRTLMIEDEIACQLLVPCRLYPFDLEPLLPVLARAELICVAEESTAGGTWGAEIAQQVHRRLWSALRRPVALVHSADSVIPAAAHLEAAVLVQDATIISAVRRALRG